MFGLCGLYGGKSVNVVNLHENPNRDWFAEFWSIYPRRIGKRHALKAFQQACKRSDPEEILAGAQLVAELVKSGKQDLQYTKHPQTWLNGDCWEDEIIVESSFQRPFGPRRTWAEIKAGK